MGVILCEAADFELHAVFMFESLTMRVCICV